jgi:hypothetical protein
MLKNYFKKLPFCIKFSKYKKLTHFSFSATFKWVNVPKPQIKRTSPNNEMFYGIV